MLQLVPRGDEDIGLADLRGHPSSARPTSSPRPELARRGKVSADLTRVPIPSTDRFASTPQNRTPIRIIVFGATGMVGQGVPQACLLDATVAQWSAREKDLYEPHIRKMRRLVPATERSAVRPERVADTVMRALNAKRPRRRYRGELASRAQLHAMMLAPVAVTDRASARIVA